MATESRPAFIIKADWNDIVADDPAISNVRVLLQNRGDDPVDVVFGGSEPPAADVSRLSLHPEESFPATAPNIWVRGAGVLSVVIF